MTAPDKSSTTQAMEEALHRCQRLAEASQFAAATMHEINNPLETIGNLAYLVDVEADSPAKVREYITLLNEQLAHVTRITQEGLDFHRSSSSHKSVDLVFVAEAALRTHEHRAAAKRIHLVKDFIPSVTVRGHSGELLRVTSNLLANALDALPTNGTLRIRVRNCPREGHLTVADNGTGVAEGVLEHIFDPFFTTKGSQGTGLGLSISKSIMDRHNGRIQARTSTRPGRSGTAFRVSLPLETRLLG